MAAGAAPVMMLDEHFRSDPHLIDFVARRLYGGSLKVTTRTPASDTNDCVTVIRIDVGHIGSEPAPATDSGVARRAGDAEISVVVRQLQRLLAEGERSVGVVTPLRAHAEAIERSVLSSLSTTEIELLNLRIGTAHQFQGAERDTMIVSLGVAPSAAPGTWTFVQDEHLLAVLLTRARKRMIVVLAADPPAPGLLADYLAQADAPPAPPGPAGPSTAWAAAIAADLSSAGRSATLAYPTGRHIIDIAVAADPRPAAVDCTVHPDGPAAHVERHLALAHAGWRITEAFPLFTDALVNPDIDESESHDNEDGDVPGGPGHGRADIVIELLGTLDSERPG